MSDLKKYLVLVLVVAAVSVLGRLAWEMLLPAISDAIATVPSLFAAVPVWVWWTVFGISMKLLFSRKRGLFGRGCGRMHACTPRRSAA